MLKYLRIAATALCLTACVLLVALWVRSFRYDDVLEKRTGSQVFQVRSLKGRLLFSKLDPFRNNPLRDPVIAKEILESASTGRTHRSSPANESIGHIMRGNVLGFGFFDTGVTVGMVAAYWFAVLLFATLATVPWIPWLRRFSLRTLLIATALVAVGLGVIVAVN
jgi:hypothetical protein